MTHLAPHPTHLRTSKPRPGWWRLGLAAGLGVVAASSAAAQVQVGDTRAPSVSVDLSVLDGLGPAPNLPQLFGASRPYPGDETAQTVAPYRPALPKTSKTASEKRHPATKQVAHRKPSTPRRVAAVSDASVHLVPPSAPSTASDGGLGGDASPAPSPNRPGPVAVASPVPTPASIPKPPSAAAVPPPPAVPPAPAHDDTPAPPSQPAGAGADSAPTELAPPPTATAAAAAPSTPAAARPGPATAPPAPVQVAAAASAGAIVNTVKFAVGATDLPPDSQPVLNTVAAKLIADDTLRVQLVAHATGNTDQAMEARRVSLARAVAVRAYLIDKGVRSLRMDVRALGNRADEGAPSDQVDLLIVSQ